MAAKEQEDYVESPLDEEDETKRKRTLTPKGKELFYSHNKDYCMKLKRLENNLVQVNEEVRKCPKDLKQLGKCRESLNTYYHQYNQVASDYVAFLSRTGTIESDAELEQNIKSRDHVQTVFDEITAEIDNLIMNVVEEYSTSTKQTRRSKAASEKLSVKIVEKRAKSEAAKVALEYVTKETELLKKQALIEAERTIVEHQKLYAVLKAEVKVLEEEGGSVVNSIGVPAEDSKERTKNYVDQLNAHKDKNRGSYEPPLPPPRQQEVRDPDTFIYQQASTPLNPHVASFMPPNDVSRMFLRKELLLQSLTKFDDSPDSYTVWKASFKEVTNEMQLSDTEELDLLLKWLGQKSQQHAKNIRRSNLKNPKLCLSLTWERLDEKFGSPESILFSLERRIDTFPSISSHDYNRLYDLYDLLSEVECTKLDPKYATHLSYFDSPAGVNPIAAKLPVGLQDKWEGRAFKYKDIHHVIFPPFTEFVKYIHEISRLKNDPSFSRFRSCHTPAETPKKQPSHTSLVQVRKTDVVNKCPLHNTEHNLNDCTSFKAKPYQERIDFMKKKGLCFKCCQPRHLAGDCKEPAPRCEVCGGKHITALHMTQDEWTQLKAKRTAPKVGQENKDSKAGVGPNVSSKCTEVCGSDTFSGKSCGKTILVRVHPRSNPKQSIKLYAIIDDQSNSCLVKPKFFELMNIDSKKIPYSLSTCAGITKTSGRRASGFQIESLTRDCMLDLPTLIECNDIPNFKEEIATPAVAKNHKHLVDIADSLPPLDDSAEVLLLIGRNMTEAFHVKDQRIGPAHSPYAQRLPLGWVVIGETCLGKQHSPDMVNVNFTHIMGNGRPTLLKPCSNSFMVKEDFVERHWDNDDVFEVTKDDNKPGLSTEDRQFLKIMDQEMHRGEAGSWSAPLPLCDPRPRLPNNRKQAEQRAKSLHNSLCRDIEKKKHMLEFMEKIMKAKHAEIAPSVDANKEIWYLPLFGVRHPRKPDNIRGVFDASAAYGGLSLNSILLQGPDLMNRLLHVLLCFRKEPIAIMGDIEKMFYCFQVHPQYRDFLRFFWYRENDPSKDLIEYHMTVHVFGNKSSPAVATYGLRRIAEAAAEEFGSDVQDFIHKNFYVDDGLTSLPTEDEAIDLLRRTQDALKTYGRMRFHKIASNSVKVMEAFPPEDRTKDLQNIDIKDLGSAYSVQRSLGVSWNIETDMFMLQVCDDEKPFTKRGVLSTIGSIYDPLGFFSPVTIKGRLIMRKLLTENIGWDDPIPSDYHKEWENWRGSLKQLETVSISRTFVPSSFKQTTDKKLLLYCDASEKAIAAVAYLKVTTSDGDEQIGFVMGKVKIAPSHGHTIPRLELCSAVLAIELAETVCESLGIPPLETCFHSDSKIVLGYIKNKTKKFKIYVSNRITRILNFSNSDQWVYVVTKRNPADSGTRSLDAADLADSSWLKGPQNACRSDENVKDAEETESDMTDTEIDETDVVSSKATHLVESCDRIGTDRFQRFSSWKNLVNGIAQLKHLARNSQTPKLEQICVSTYTDSENFILREVQHENFSKGIQCLKDNKPIPKESPLFSLNAFLDGNELLRVGGRLNKTGLNTEYKNPLILPKKSHVSRLIILHFHEQVRHQGRQLTEGAVRSGGYWIIGGKRLISSLIHQCITCRKLRGRTEPPKMADLPCDRLEESPPFTYVGLDTFGPWNVVSRRTRGGCANSKRWAILFTCLVTRAIHIEIVEELSTSAFINALKRFIAIRGDVKQFRSDRGTNFVGSIRELNINAINVEDRNVKSFLKDNRTEWIFNPPHASHMGGAWERMIGVCRRILDSMLTGVAATGLTHDVIVTLMAEVCAIVNNRPIVPVSSDPESPCVLSPAVLLTQKSKPVSNISGKINSNDMKSLYKAQWMRVQQLADMFWARWRSEYLHTLQVRRKWQTDVPNLQTGDIVLLKDKDVPRNNWPMAVIAETKPSVDGRVRTVTVRTARDGKSSVYTRPVTDLIPILKVKCI